MKVLYEETYKNFKKRTGRFWIFPLIIYIQIVLITVTIILGYGIIHGNNNLIIINIISLILIIFCIIYIFQLLIRTLKDKPIKVLNEKNTIYFIISGHTVNINDVDYYYNKIPRYLLYRVDGRKLRKKIELTGWDDEVWKLVEKYVPIENRYPKSN